MSQIPQQIRADRDRPAALAASEASQAKAKRETALRDAAPELLAALQFVMTASGEQLSTAFEQAQAAIAKATGDTAP